MASNFSNDAVRWPQPNIYLPQSDSQAAIQGYRSDCASNSGSIADGEKDSHSRLWEALLDVVCRECDEKVPANENTESNFTEIGYRKEEMMPNYDVKETVAQRLEVRSKSGRTVAPPRKYKDSFVGAVAEAEILRVAKRTTFVKPAISQVSK